MCDMPIKKEWERTGEEEEGPAVEVEIYSGIEFTRLHKGPMLPLLSFSVLKNTWCKLTLASRNSKRRKERGEEEQGSRHERRKFQGLLWGLRNVYTLYHRPCSFTKSLKEKKNQHHHRLPSQAASLQQHCCLIQTPWHLYMCSSLTYCSLYLFCISVPVDLMLSNWLTHACPLIKKVVFKNSNVPFPKHKAIYVNKWKPSTKPINQSEVFFRETVNKNPLNHEINQYF